MSAIKYKTNHSTICVETARKESHVTDFRTAENGLIVIQAKNITLPFFSITIIFGILSISWQ